VYFGLICRWFDMALRASLLLETRTSSMSRYDSRCYSCMYPSFSFTYAITPRDTSCTHSPLILRLDQRFISSPSTTAWPWLSCYFSFSQWMRPRIRVVAFGCYGNCWIVTYM
jgi:hypothetical protein